MNFVAKILGALGLGAAKTGSQACLMMFWDEEDCPESLIK